jgi:amino acid transporter
VAVETQEQVAGEGAQLRRNLKLWQVIGLSVGLMAPSMAISINPQFAVAAAGRAIPLSFLISLVGALFVAYGFARLSQHFNHSGSVLGLVGATLGPRAGVVAGWCLAGTYTLFALLTAVTAGIYGVIFLHDVGAISSEPEWLKFVIGAAVIVVAGFLAAVPTSKATEVILSFEGVTMLLILIAVVIVLIKLVGQTGPGHLGFTLSVFSPAKGTTVSNIFSGVVFGFLSFGGFEAAATLGGEADRPRRDIPRALFATVLIIGVFYVAVAAIEVMGFGTSAEGLKNFAGSLALPGDLGRSYVAGWFGDLIILGTVVSAFGCTMASCVGASRLVYSFARDGISADHPVARLHPRWCTPARAVAVICAVQLVLVLVLALAAKGNDAFTATSWAATTGTYLILVVYGLASVGAWVYLFARPLLRHEPLLAPAAELILPLLGVAVVVYTLYKNVSPYPTGSSFWLPIVAGVWLVLAIAAVVGRPATSRRMGERLVFEEMEGEAAPV